MLAAQEDTLEIDRDRAAEPFQRLALDVGRDRDAGGVHERGEGPETRLRGSDSRLPLRFVRDIQPVEQRGRAEFDGQSLALLELAVGDGHLGAFGDEASRRRRADTAGGACDQRDLSRKSHAAS